MLLPAMCLLLRAEAEWGGCTLGDFVIVQRGTGCLCFALGEMGGKYWCAGCFCLVDL